MANNYFFDLGKHRNPWKIRKGYSKVKWLKMAEFLGSFLERQKHSRNKLNHDLVCINGLWNQLGLVL